MKTLKFNKPTKKQKLLYSFFAILLLLAIGSQTAYGKKAIRLVTLGFHFFTPDVVMIGIDYDGDCVADVFVPEEELQTNLEGATNLLRNGTCESLVPEPKDVPVIALAQVPTPIFPDTYEEQVAYVFGEYLNLSEDMRAQLLANPDFQMFVYGRLLSDEEIQAVIKDPTLHFVLCGQDKSNDPNYRRCDIVLSVFINTTTGDVTIVSWERSLLLDKGTRWMSYGDTINLTSVVSEEERHLLGIEDRGDNVAYAISALTAKPVDGIFLIDFLGATEVLGSIVPEEGIDITMENKFGISEHHASRPGMPNGLYAKGTYRMNQYDIMNVIRSRTYQGWSRSTEARNRIFVDIGFQIIEDAINRNISVLDLLAIVDSKVTNMQNETDHISFGSYPSPLSEILRQLQESRVSKVDMATFAINVKLHTTIVNFTKSNLATQEGYYLNTEVVQMYQAELSDSSDDEYAILLGARSKNGHLVYAFPPIIIYNDESVSNIDWTMWRADYLLPFDDATRTKKRQEFYSLPRFILARYITYPIVVGVSP